LELTILIRRFIMFQKLLSPKWLVTFSVILTTLMSVTLASAHGGNLALIHSCVNNTSGEIKIIAATANCPSNYHSLDWNVQCPAGKQVLAGGYSTAGNNSNISFVTNAPYGSYRWVVTAVTNDYPNVRSGWDVTAFAICANVAP